MREIRSAWRLKKFTGWLKMRRRGSEVAREGGAQLKATQLDRLRKVLQRAPEDARQVAVGGMTTAAVTWCQQAPPQWCPDCGQE
eukprot:14663849-Alexandrium_andersonii.AAC.1